MNLFQIKTKPHDIERFEDFIRDNFVAIGWPGIGDLSNVDREEIRDRLVQVYGYSGQQLGAYLGWVNAFVHTMSEGDLVMITRADYVYIGEVGAYEYHDEFDNKVDGMCHQRPVRWLKVVHKKDLNSEVQELLRNRGTVTQFKHPFERANMDFVLGDKIPSDAGTAVKDSVQVPDRVIAKAILILTDALESDDPRIQIQAASVLLNYAKSR